MLADLTSLGIDASCVATVSARQASALLQSAKSLGVADRLDLIGQVDESRIGHLLGRAFAVVLSSTLEFYGLPYYEAMSAGRPLVASDRSFAREACADAALYADPGDSASFSYRVLELARSASQARELSQKTLARFQAVNTTWTGIAEGMASILREAADS